MNEKEVVDLLDIKADDNRDQIKAKFGAFRLKWLKDDYEGRATKFTIDQIDQIAAVISKMIGPGTPEEEKESKELMASVEHLISAEEERKKERISFLMSPVIFVVFLAVAILLSIGMWGVHPVLGLFGVIISVWMINNKWKTGYYFGE